MQVFSPQPEAEGRTTTPIVYWLINAPDIGSHRTAQPRFRGDIERAGADLRLINYILDPRLKRSFNRNFMDLNC
jgi:hypothetical protein